MATEDAEKAWNQDISVFASTHGTIIANIFSLIE